MREYGGEGDKIYHNLWQVKTVSMSQRCAWRVFLNRLPTRDRLPELRISVGSSVYVLCNLRVETMSHVFFTCSVMSQIWKLCK